MNIDDSSDSTGVSSSKGREDGDGSTGSERPLKKARYAWQVKGKYHLKNENNEANRNSGMHTTDPPVDEPAPGSNSTANAIGNELEDYLTKHDYNMLESVVDPDTTLLTPNICVSKDKQQYPRYNSSQDRTTSFMKRSNYVKTMSLASIMEDQCIAQWQARQMVKGCVDNTINRVLETWSDAPLPPEENNSRFLALDFAEFINHLPGDNTVENEGILMAISAHGLQNPSSNSSYDTADNCSASSVAAFDIPSPLRCLSPLLSDEDTTQINNQHCTTEKKSPNDFQMPWQCNNSNVDVDLPFPYLSEPSNSPYNNIFDDNFQSSNDCSGDSDNHFDFMNAAVMYAINSKGLTASGTEYG